MRLLRHFDTLLGIEFLADNYVWPSPGLSSERRLSSVTFLCFS